MQLEDWGHIKVYKSFFIPQYGRQLWKLDLPKDATTQSLDIFHLTFENICLLWHQSAGSTETILFINDGKNPRKLLLN